MTDIIVTPRVVDDVEFYISDDGSYCGLSKNGLARLAGVARGSLYSLLELLDTYNPQDGKELINCLKPLANNVYLRMVKAPKNAHIVSSDAAAVIIAYYAVEARTSPEVKRIALNSLTKFAAKGIQNWIKEITQFEAQANNNEILDTLNELLGEVKDLKAKTQEYEGLRKTTVTVYPGLDKMINDFVDQNSNVLPENIGEEESYSLSEWLQLKGITLNKPQLHKLAVQVAETFKTMTADQPTKKMVESTQKGQKTNRVNAYYKRHFPILNVALVQMMSRECSSI